MTFFVNHLANLRWIDYSGNTQSYHDNHRPKRSILQYDRLGKLVKKWDCINDILKENGGYKRKTILASLCDHPKISYEYYWKYEIDIKKKENVIA